jgi:hypothetical protein
VLGGDRHLAHQVARHEHRPALGGEVLQERADPADAVRVQAVDRLVEHDDGRVAEQGGGDAQPLTHAEREAAGPAVRDPAQADGLQHLVDPLRPDPVRLCQREQVVTGAAAAVRRLRLQQRAEDAQRGGVRGVAPAEHRGDAGRGPVQPDDHAHRRRLAGAVGSEESRHLPGPHLERQPVDGHGRAVPLGQVLHFDHAVDARCAAPRRGAPRVCAYRAADAPRVYPPHPEGGESAHSTTIEYGRCRA